MEKLGKEGGRKKGKKGDGCWMIPGKLYDIQHASRVLVMKGSLSQYFTRYLLVTTIVGNVKVKGCVQLFVKRIFEPPCFLDDIPSKHPFFLKAYCITSQGCHYKGKKLGNPLTDVIKLVPDKKSKPLLSQLPIFSFQLLMFFAFLPIFTLETVFIFSFSLMRFYVFLHFLFFKKLAKDKKSHLQ